MMERTAQQTAALADELRNVMRQAEKLVLALSEDRDEALVELRERLSVAVAEGKRRMADIEEQARLFKDTAGRAVDQFVQDNPWTAVGVSAALGLILGAWLASDHRE
ncbi:MAG: DUF883 domain-containing protein [Proteobacteria bacterium]|nr:DUF883 domain-containing protein [Pseudomonadota bacterium]